MDLVPRDYLIETPRGKTSDLKEGVLKEEQMKHSRGHHAHRYSQVCGRRLGNFVTEGESGFPQLSDPVFALNAGNSKQIRARRFLPSTVPTILIDTEDSDELKLCLT